MMRQPNVFRRKLIMVFFLVAVVAVGQALADIIIERAFYGYGQRGKNVTNLLQSYIRGDRINVQVTNANMGGDPYPGKIKNLRVEYRVRRDGEIRQANVMENDWLVIEGRPGGPGGPGPGPGGPGHGPGPGPGYGRLEILDARYGAKGIFWDVTNRLRRYIRGDRLRIVVCNENLGGDPLPGADKRLTVSYAYNGSRRQVVVPEYQYLSLPDMDGDPGGPPRRGRLEILDADYGWGRNWRDVTRILRDRVYRDRLEIYVSNRNLGGDPAPGKDKELRVTYRYRGRQYTISASEYEYLILPEDIGY
ncbi:MAG: DUF3395 domain-containing protein [Acidobacteria bacterium]|nr:DUF3395 domain-containing protein [Acidobacteriota bacterium]